MVRVGGEALELRQAGRERLSSGFGFDELHHVAAVLLHEGLLAPTAEAVSERGREELREG